MKGVSKMLKEYLNLGFPSWVTIESEKDSITEKYSENKAYFGDTTIEFEKNNEHTDIFITAQETRLKYIKIRWNEKLPKDGLFLSDAWERNYGTMGFKGMLPNRIMPWYFISVKDDITTGYGVEVQPNAMCMWQVDTAGLTLILDVRNGGNGVHLNGRILKAAKLITMKYKGGTSFEAAQEFCREMCPNPIFPDFPVYGSNNWYYAYGNSSESEILSDTDYVLKVTQETKNPPFMVIDDCWQENHRLDEYNGGPWTKGNKKFPNMKGLAKKLKNKGVRPGIWTRLLLNEDPKIEKEWRLPLNDCLDPTHPDVIKYIKSDVERFCEWGYQLIKHDFSTYDIFNRWGFQMNPMVTEENWNFYDKSITSAEVIKQFYRAIYEVTNKYGVLILGCNTIGHLGAGLMQLNRIGDDTSGFNWERTRQIGINTLAFRLPQHNTFFHIDADCVGIAGHIDWKFNKQWADVLARTGTPLFISAKPNVLNKDQEKDLSKIMKIAAKQEKKYFPVDWEVIDCPEIWGTDNDRITYEWYENAGLQFKTNPIRYSSFFSIE